MSDKTEHLRKILLNLVTELVEYPGDLTVESSVTAGGATVLTVYPDRLDLGKVIGRRGCNAKAMRTLLESIAAKHRVKVVIEIPDVRQGR